jgi:hypothetical protein
VLALTASGGDFTVSTGACLANDLNGTFTTDTSTPAAGDAGWYLVRAGNCAGHGTYDDGTGGQAGSRDVEIGASPSACP